MRQRAARTLPPGERPLAEILRRYRGNFYPEHPELPPWEQPSLDLAGVEWATTDNRAVVNLMAAGTGRVELRDLERPTGERDWELGEFRDWTPAGFGRWSS